jgi:glutathione S-transferase
MADDLVFYTNPMSRGRTVRWMLEEVGHPYRTEVLDFGTTMKAPAYLALNPLGKVPAIDHRGEVVTEVAAICAYLADAFPDAGLAPEPTDRAAYYRWMFFTAGPIEAATVNQALGVVVSEDRQRMVGYGQLPTMLDVIEAALDGRTWITSDRFTAADVFVGAMLGWGMRFKSIESRPAFAAYWQRLSERPAFRRATELDDALMPKQEAGA